jgi:CRP-like cAMP-binding protein
VLRFCAPVVAGEETEQAHYPRLPVMSELLADLQCAQKQEKPHDGVVVVRPLIGQPRWKQTMRARVTRHLRELALPTPDGRAVVYISHQRLADAVGTVREVISRQLGTLRADGLIDTQTGMIVLLDDERLEGIAASRKSL